MVATSVCAQKQGVNWLSFEQLEDSLSVKPKKTLIFFTAQWCAYCKKMEEVSFKDPDILSTLNTAFYSVKMDVETSDTIYFGGQQFVNKEFQKKRNPVHQIAKLLASRNSMPFSVPVLIILDSNFRVQQRFFEYQSPKKMRSILSK